MSPAESPVTAWVAAGIATLALLLGAFNFYWTHLRKARALYLLPIHGIGVGTSPEFALVNSGDSDLMITGIVCQFDNAAGNGGVIPNQKLWINDASEKLLESRKAAHCRIEFLEQFDEEFALEGIREEGQRSAYVRRMRILIDWIDAEAVLHRREVLFGQYGFTEKGQITSFRPLPMPHNKRFDLYAKV